MGDDDSHDPAHMPIAPVAEGVRYADWLIRPIQPSDAEALRDAFDHWSEESRYLRFHTAMRHLSDRLLEYLTHVDGINHVALVATLAADPAVGLGVGRFVKLPNDPQRADLALAVIDDAQGHGVARGLLIELAKEAEARGITIFRMDVLGGNAHVRELLTSVGAHCVECEEGVLSYELPIATLRAAAAQLT
jgi:GNAT superfamily N-acetyltransferase